MISDRDPSHYLVLAGDPYYPSEGTGDWQGIFATQKSAMAHIAHAGYEGWWTLVRIDPDGTFETIDFMSWPNIRRVVLPTDQPTEERPKGT